ncbi:hypothetical protein [Lactococcus kimchii]|uniref:hypothetical protein n=1 Tax=Lactococcus sp. S-13 TaxID=2507158 RepID=UPI001023F362|nr:hypothetical protein [Lactococcus sp. S-13]RZI47896.1 hypothetical protein EQJ87_10775 [Lactococcus sp. S-13]
MKVNLKRFQNLIRSPSGGLLFGLTSVVLLMVVIFAAVTLFLTGVGTDKAAVATKAHTLKVSSTASSNHAKAKSSPQVKEKKAKVNAEAVQTTSQSQVQNNVAPPQPCPNQPESSQPQYSQPAPVPEQNSNDQAQALREAELQQEAENQKEAERLKAEYEAEGDTVNFIYQNVN